MGHRRCPQRLSLKQHFKKRAAENSTANGKKILRFGRLAPVERGNEHLEAEEQPIMGLDSDREEPGSWVESLSA